MIFRLITILFVVGFLFRVLFRYVFPIFHITSTATSRLRQMQDQMKEMEQKINTNNTPKPSGKKEGDYIDYEEVK